MTRSFFKPRLWLILAAANLVLVLVPLSGIWVFRLYEGELLRRTESELISQSVLIREMVIDQFRKLAGSDLSPMSHPVNDRYRSLHSVRPGEYRHMGPRIDLSHDDKRPPLAESPRTVHSLAPVAATIGSALEVILEGAQFNLLSGIRVVDHQGVITASTADDVGTSLREREEVDRALKGEPVSLLRWRRDGERPWHVMFSSTTSTIVFVAQPIVFNDRVLGAVVVSRTPTSLPRALMEHRTRLLWYGAAVLAFLIISALLTASMMAQPIRRLVSQIAAVRDGNAQAAQPLAWPGSREVDVLSHAIAEMASTLDARARYIEDFSRALSHEFKTPIAAIRGSVELLSDHHTTMTPAEHNRFIGMIDRDACRMERLVQRLLELARADMVTHRSQSAPLHTTLETLVDERHHVMKIQLNWVETTPTTQVGISADHLRTCVINLLDNALQHGGPEVTVTITTTLECWANRNCVNLTVCNNGTPIPADIRSQILEPFFTTARATGGTGLGLSIVKTLVDSAHGSLSLGSAGQGACFEIRLPLHHS